MASTLPGWIRVLKLVLLFASIWLPCPVSANANWGGHGGAVHVMNGESIQAALDSAQPGECIVVEAGTYAEQLTVATDGINLIGMGAILVPPSSFTQNTCSGLAGPDTEAGICVTGQNVQLADFVTEHRKVLSVGRPVSNVLVTGFNVQGFSGLNIAVVGGQNTQVTQNVLSDGAKYGSLTVGSTNSLINANNVFSTGELKFIAICMDDMASVQVINNHITGYFVGLCVQTNGAEVHGNDVSDCCNAVYVDPGVIGAHVHGNHISNGDPVCVTIPDVSISGIAVVGSQDTQVQGNLIEGLTAGGVNGSTATGIAILDDPLSGTVANGNVATGNLLKGNDFDIFVNTTGSGNVVQDNQCSDMTQLC